jgi:hypothetical protein
MRRFTVACSRLPRVAHHDYSGADIKQKGLTVDQKHTQPTAGARIGEN